MSNCQTLFTNRTEANRHAEAALDADQIEYEAMRYDVASMNDGLLDEIASGEVEDQLDIDSSKPDHVQRDELLDDEVGNAALEIKRRAEELASYYPFERTDGALVYKQSETHVYEFCLAISQIPGAQRQGSEFSKYQATFEALTALLFRGLLGRGSDAYRSGYSSANTSRPTRFRKVAEELEVKTGGFDFKWDPERGYPPDPSPRHIKDLGVDVVIWRRIGVYRPGAVYYLGQCACGNNWRNKLDDLHIAKLTPYFRPLMTPIGNRFLAIPYHVPNHSKLREIHNKAGLTLDRCALARLAEEIDWLRKDVQAEFTPKLNELREQVS